MNVLPETMSMTMNDSYDEQRACLFLERTVCLKIALVDEALECWRFHESAALSKEGLTPRGTGTYIVASIRGRLKYRYSAVRSTCPLAGSRQSPRRVADSYLR